ncbi:glycosyltransferase [Haloferula sp.]|uniref:glycosyltransferase n=1 Tax=Haloferula sp. TaxID=2497595 RepID=UPI00329D3E2D
MAKRWYTCTPVEFGGGPDFFARDSGLLSRGLQAIGVESRAVMPSVAKEDDEGDLIRTDYRNLESAEWWKSHELDGVVLYAWGRPKFRKVARAIREAGIFLVLNQDNSGLVSPLVGLGRWMGEQKLLAGAGQVPGGWARFAKETAKGLSVGLAITDPLRAAHLRNGDIIACVSPSAVDRYQKLCRIYGGAELERKVRLVPHPVNPGFGLHGETKLRRVVTIGRWNDEVQKRPELMMRVFAELLARDPQVEVDVIGKRTATLDQWHADLAKEVAARTHLRGLMTPDEIQSVLSVAQVSYCSSAYESFHIASGEALCSGCSVVGSKSDSLASLSWFCADGSGALAGSDDVVGHVSALLAELDAWADGQRDARSISSRWTKCLSAPEVARLILDMSESN